MQKTNSLHQLIYLIIDGIEFGKNNAIDQMWIGCI